MDINETIDLCKQGNTDAFKYIVSEYQQLVYTLAFNSEKNATFSDFNHFLRIKKERQQTQRRLYSHIINKHLNL